MALSLQANYTDWATAMSWRNLVPTFSERVVSRSQRGGSPRFSQSRPEKFRNITLIIHQHLLSSSSSYNIHTFGFVWMENLATSTNLALCGWRILQHPHIWLRMDGESCNIHTFGFGFFLLKSWATQNFITIETSWNTND
jgi:hypothetical protein